MLRSAPLLLLAGTVLLGGCSVIDAITGKDDPAKPDTPPPNNGAVDPDAGVPITPENLRPALPKTTFTFGACSGAYAQATSCGTAKVPLDYTKPDGKTIDLFVAKMGNVADTAPQLYMLQGGPGASAADLVFLAKMVLADRPDLQILLLDHRGVGRSTRLACDTAEAAAQGTDVAADTKACLAEVEKTWPAEDLAQFTTSNAARDLAVAVQSLKQPNVPTFIYGVSYGTYWVHRFLQLSPVDVEGAIIDSIVNPADFKFDQFNTHYDPVLQRLAQACGRSPSCAQRLGVDSFLTMKQILDTSGSSACASVFGVDSGWVRDFTIGLMMQSGIADYVPSFLFRWQRCNASDQSAIDTLLNATAPADDSGAEKTESDALYDNVVFSEGWTKPAPTVQALQAQAQTLAVSSSATIDNAVKQTVWPAYAADSYMGKFADTPMPVLMLNGDLDVQTPIEQARDAAQKITGGNKVFVAIPNANHGTIASSATVQGGDPCGLTITLDFLKDPKKIPTTSCISSTLPPNAEGDPDFTLSLYGTSSAWADLRGPQPLEAAVANPKVERALRGLRNYRRDHAAVSRRGI